MSLALALAACASNNPAAIAPEAGYVPPRDLTALAGLAPSQVAALYGQPDFRRADPPAEVWQYRNADCVLDLYFYSGDSGEQLTYAQSRPRGFQQSATAGHCLGGDAAPLHARTTESKL